MDRHYRTIVLGASLGLLLTTAGCQGAFHRRGIPPEPKSFQEAPPAAQFHSDPNPMAPNMGMMPANPAAGMTGNPYGNAAPYGGETVPPLGQASGGIPGTGPSPISEPPAQAPNALPQ